MATVIKSSFVWGIETPKLLKGFPAGRVRLRLRHHSIGKAFVRTADGLRVFLIKNDGDWWVPGCEIGCNLTTFSLFPYQAAWLAADAKTRLGGR